MSAKSLHNWAGILLVACLVVFGMASAPVVYASDPTPTKTPAPTRTPRPTPSRELTITITDAEFSRFLASVPHGPTIAKLSSKFDVGGILIQVDAVPASDSTTDHFGVLIRDGKIVTEPGVMDIPGQGGVGYATLLQVAPEIAKEMVGNSKILQKYILQRVTAKAGSRYTPISVTTNPGQIVIVVNR